MGISLKCREAKKSEISLLVEAYRCTLLECILRNQTIILPTERTLQNCTAAINQSYERGYKSYIAESEGEIFGYLVFIADNLLFDLAKNSCSILTLFVEPVYRNLGIGKFLLESVESDLKERGVQFISTHLSGVKYLPRLFKKWNTNKVEVLQINLDNK